LLLFIF